MGMKLGRSSEVNATLSGVEIELVFALLTTVSETLADCQNYHIWA